jgi:hypothetical protein
MSAQGVIRVVLTTCRPLPVYPDQRTSTDRSGWSGSCQFRTRAAGEALESGMGYRPPLLGSLVNDGRRRL